MKAGRAIGGEEDDARRLAERLVDDARAEAERVRESAQADATRLRRDAKALAGRILADARAEAERLAHQSRPSAAEAAGNIDEVVGLVALATVGDAALGEVVRIDRRDRAPVGAEVVGVRGERAVLAPLGELAGVAPGAAVWRTGEPAGLVCGDDLLGRVLDALGEPIDGGPALRGERWAVDRAPPPALARPPISAPQPTGVRAIDALVTLGRGQRVGVFAPRGGGKSTLLAQIARGAAADVVVACKVGELGEIDDRARTVVVHAASDAPPLVRARAASTATAIAEWFRERRGASVVLLVDSVTRVAHAQRDIGIAAGESPLRDGYPPSVFALLAKLVERAGASATGAVTAIYAALDGAIADELRGIVDGELVLDRRLLERGQFPPIDVAASTSRVMPRVVDGDHAARAAVVRAQLADGNLGPFEAFLRQRRDESTDWDASVAQLVALQPLTLAGPR